jgi:hypothetical protein
MVKTGKHIVTFIFVFICGIFFAQKPDIQLSINKKPVEVGQSVVFTLKANIDGQVQFDFPSSFIQGGNSRSVQQSLINNTWSFVVENAQEGVFKKEGKYTITATVKEKGKTYKSNSLTVTVKLKSDPTKARKFDNTEGEITKHNMKEAIFGIIEKSSAKVYEGEPLILAAKVYSRVSLNMMRDYKPFSFKGAAETFELEKSDNFSLNRENFQGTTFLTFSSNKQLVFPAITGKFIVKPFEMVLQFNRGGFFDEQARIESNATFIEVLPLPKGAPKDFIGAVGKYSLQTSISNTSAKVGDVITLEMNVKGTGNLHTISKPKLNLPDGLSIYGDPEIKEELDYTDEGVTGFKKFIFHLKVNKGGKIDLPNLSISYFDPSLKKYVTVKGKAETIDVEGSEEIAKVQAVDTINIQSDEEVLVKPTASNDENNQKTIPHANKWIAFLLIVIVVLGGLLFISSRKKSKKKNEEIITNQAVEEIQPEIFIQQEKPSSTFLDDAYTYALRQDYTAAFGLIHKHLPKYIAHQLSSGSSTPSVEVLSTQMESQNVSLSIIEDYQFIIKTCEEVMYGYLDRSENWEEISKKVSGIITYLNNR